jgi:hypothetical protein
VVLFVIFAPCVSISQVKLTGNPNEAQNFGLHLNWDKALDSNERFNSDPSVFTTGRISLDHRQRAHGRAGVSWILPSSSSSLTSKQAALIVNVPANSSPTVAVKLSGCMFVSVMSFAFAVVAASAATC